MLSLKLLRHAQVHRGCYEGLTESIVHTVHLPDLVSNGILIFGSESLVNSNDVMIVSFSYNMLHPRLFLKLRIIYLKPDLIHQAETHF